MTKLILSGLCFLNVTLACGQEALQDSLATISAKVEAQGIATTNDQVPFWMRTNQYGSIPLAGISGSMVARFEKEFSYDYNHKRTLDWGAGIESRFDLGRNINATIIEAYLKASWGIVQLKGGRSRDVMGIADKKLSAGNFAVSGNALGIPKLELSIPEYWTIPLTAELISVKASLSYGLCGNTAVNPNIAEDKRVSVFYHQKSLYGRIGKPDWKLKIYAGLNHQVMWGGEQSIFGDAFTLSPLETFMYVTLGKTYGNDSIPWSKVGNHIGSIDQAFSYSFKSAEVLFYHQFFYDVGGFYHLNNIKDGLWGLTISNKNKNLKSLNWQKLLVELMFTKSQGGEFTSKISPSGDEDYYNNYLYPAGWTFNGENIGNNFITNKKYLRKELPAQSHEYIGNNRIFLLHLGLEGNLKRWNFISKMSYSRNYGTYATSPIGNTTGKKRTVFPGPYFSPVNQFSAYLETSRTLKNGYSVGFVLAGDYGDLLYNTVGGMVKLSKTW